jgi:hypothetical protein
MREQLDVAGESGVRRVQLEVLTQNWAARSYERAGFVTTRRLSVLQGTLGGAVPRGARVPDAEWLDPLPVSNLAAQLTGLHATHPAAWTREPQAALSLVHGVRGLVLGPAWAAEGVALVRQHDGAVHVVDAAAGDATAARALVAEIATEYGGRECRVVNEPEGSHLVEAFVGAGLVEVVAQYEMHWRE